MFSFTSLNSVCVSLYLSIFFFSSSFSPLVLSNQNLSQHFICVLFRFTVPAPKQRLSWLKTIHLKIIIFPPLLQAQCSFLWLSIKLSISAATTIHLITVESHPFFFFFSRAEMPERQSWERHAACHFYGNREIFWLLKSSSSLLWRILETGTDHSIEPRLRLPQWPPRPRLPPGRLPGCWGSFTAAFPLKLRGRAGERALCEINVSAGRVSTTAPWSICIENTIKVSVGEKRKPHVCLLWPGARQYHWPSTVAKC